MTRLLPVALVSLFVLAACSDPQHGAWKVKSGVWTLWLLLLVAFVGAALIVGAWLVARRRLS